MTRYRWIVKMKGIMRILFLALHMFIMPMFAEIVSFGDDATHIHLSYDAVQWRVAEPESFRDRLTIAHNTANVTLTVIAYQFNETITANGLVQRRVQSEFDGWQLLNQKPLNSMELHAFGVREGITSIYRKGELDASLNEVFQIVGDICMVTTNNLGIIINTHAASAQDLISVKKQIHDIYDSFWYGVNRPKEQYSIANHNEWVMMHQNLFRQRRVDVPVSSFREMDVMDVHTVDVSDVSKLTMYFSGTKTVLFDEFYIKSKRLSDTSWFVSEPVALNHPILQLTDSGSYIIHKKNPSLIRRYNHQLVQEWELSINEEIQAVTAINHALFVATDNSMRLIRDTKDIIWEHVASLNIGVLAGREEQLIAMPVDTLALIGINLNTGDIQVRRTVDEGPFGGDAENVVDMVVLDESVIVLVQYASGTSLHLYQGELLQLEHAVFLKGKSMTFLGATKEVIYLIDPDGTVEAFDTQTFASIWVNSLPVKNLRLTDQGIIGVDTFSNALITYDLRTGMPINFIPLNALVNQSNTDNVHQAFIQTWGVNKSELLIVSEQLNGDVLLHQLM